MSKRDVRMRGFEARSTVTDALAWVDASSGADASPHRTEQIPARDAWGRVLATAVIAQTSVPPFVRSAMDGYALRGDETTGAGTYQPLPFRVIGESLPGRPFDGAVVPGTCVRIMTGAPLPSGADAVLPVELTEPLSGGGLVGGDISAIENVSPGKHVGQVGEDVPTGSEVLSAGRRLRPQDVGILAAVGVTTIEVWARPRVAILVTGNELAEAGTARGDHQIYDSNTDMLRALVTRDGGDVIGVTRLADDREAIRRALLASDSEVVLFSGGSSVGAEDHAPQIVAEVGELAIHGVAMRPSSPAGMGRVKHRLVFLLPGNPVSCLCAYEFFAGRAIRSLGGRSADWPHRFVRLPVGKKLVSMVGRVDYARVRIVDGQVEPVATSGASILSSTVRADGFVIIPSELEGYGPGAEVDVGLYGEP
jgi:molybdopterin molybdotransferase